MKGLLKISAVRNADFLPMQIVPFQQNKYAHKKLFASKNKRF